MPELTCLSSEQDVHGRRLPYEVRPMLISVNAAPDFTSKYDKNKMTPNSQGAQGFTMVTDVEHNVK